MVTHVSRGVNVCLCMLTDRLICPAVCQRSMGDKHYLSSIHSYKGVHTWNQVYLERLTCKMHIYRLHYHQNPNYWQAIPLNRICSSWTFSDSAPVLWPCFSRSLYLYRFQSMISTLVQSGPNQLRENDQVAFGCSTRHFVLRPFVIIIWFIWGSHKIDFQAIVLHPTGALSILWSSGQMSPPFPYELVSKSDHLQPIHGLGHLAVFVPVLSLWSFGFQARVLFNGCQNR